jgi:hypothetical protein
MLRAIWRLAPTHHSNVYWATKSPRRARFIENGFRFGASGDAPCVVGEGVGAASDGRLDGVAPGAAASGGLLGYAGAAELGDADGLTASVAAVVAVGPSSVGVQAASTSARPAAIVKQARRRRGAETVIAVS